MKPYYERILSDDVTAGGQLRWLPQEQNDSPLSAGGRWRTSYLGALRFDSLLSREIVVPDSHLLDGRFFLSEPPTTLRREIGRPLVGTQDAEVAELPLVFAFRM